MRVFRFKVLLLSFLLFVVNLSVSVRVNKGNSLNEPDRRSEHAEAKAQQNVNTAGDNKDTQKNNDKEGVSDTEDSQKDGQTLRLDSRLSVNSQTPFSQFIVRFLDVYKDFCLL